MKRAIQLGSCVLLLTLLGPRLSFAAEPSAADRLPDRTIAYVRIRNTAELADRINNTSFGLAFKDPQVRPLLEHLWSSVTETIQKFEEQAGMGLDDLVAAAPGELVVALVNVPALPPAGVLMFRPDQPDKLERTLELGTDRLNELGVTLAPDSVEGADVRILTLDEGPVREVIQLRLDDWRILTTSRRVAGSLVASWRGELKSSLADQDAFRTIMTRCGDDSTASQIQWYIDPIATVRSLTRGNIGAATAMAFLPALGLDSLQAIGGQITVADDHYDMMTRTHLLVEPPRDGVFKLLALQQGSSHPEAWVPADTASYATWQWDLKQTVTTLEQLVDSLRSEGAFAEVVQSRLSDNLGVDVQHDVLPLLAGRITQVVRIEQPPSLTSQSTAVGLELTDTKRFQQLWTTVVEKFPDKIEKINFAGIDVYRWKQSDDAARADDDQDKPRSDDPDERRRQRRRRRRREARQRWQQARPVAAFLGDFVIVADRLSLMQHMIMTYDDAEPRLRDELDYKLVVSKLKRMSSTAPGMISFERPDEGLRALYQLLQTDDVRERIHEQRERHPFFQALDELLTEDRLPSFDVLAQYLAPAGAMLVNEESGFHYVSFSLRRHIEPSQ